MVTIVLFDVLPISRLGFLNILGQLGGERSSLAVSSLGELKSIANSRRIDLLVLTVNTQKDVNPAKLIAECNCICPETPVVFYDEQCGASYVETWLRLGISGYLLKSEPSTVLLQCIELVLDEGKYLSPKAWTLLVNSGQRPAPMRMTKLGRKEFEIARLLSDGKSTTWIARALGNKPSTISTVKKRIFTKLKIDNVVDLCRIMDTVSFSGSRNALQTINISVAQPV